MENNPYLNLRVIPAVAFFLKERLNLPVIMTENVEAVGLLIFLFRLG